MKVVPTWPQLPVEPESIPIAKPETMMGPPLSPFAAQPVALNMWRTVGPFVNVTDSSVWMTVPQLICVVAPKRQRYIPMALQALPVTFHWFPPARVHAEMIG